jgi:hypothetical protein
MLSLNETQLKAIISKPGYSVRSSISLEQRILGSSSAGGNQPHKTKSKVNTLKLTSSINRHEAALHKLIRNPELETGLDLSGNKVGRANFEHWCQVRLFDYIFKNHPEHYDDFAAVPNGGHRFKSVGGELLDEGLRSGYPDIIGDLARGCYHGLRVELKYGSNKPTKEQIKQLQRKSNNGFFCAVCFSLSECIQVLEEYLLLEMGSGMLWHENEGLWKNIQA